MPRSYGTTNAAPYASAPAVGALGDTYFNSTAKTLWISDGTGWVPAGSSSNSLSGSEASRPGGVAGMLYSTTDTGRVFEHDGTGWTIVSEPLISYVPVITGITLGNGTYIGRYSRSNGFVDFVIRCSFGSTTAITGSLTLTYPFTALAAFPWPIEVKFVDATGGTYSGFTAPGTTTTATLLLQSVVGGFLAGALFSTTAPVVAAVGDEVHVSGRYPMSSRYT